LAGFRSDGTLPGDFACKFSRRNSANRLVVLFGPKSPSRTGDSNEKDTRMKAYLINDRQRIRITDPAIYLIGKTLPPSEQENKEELGRLNFIPHFLQMNQNQRSCKSWTDLK
jgi:hypothetical protein